MIKKRSLIRIGQFLLISLLFVILIACSRPEPFAESSVGFASDEGDAPASGAAFAPEEPPFEREANFAEDSVADQSGQIPHERLIIRTADINVVVANTEDSLAELAEMAEAMGGWVVNSNVFSVGTADRGAITMRIPAERFDEALSLIKDGAIEVNSESTSGQDVTEEFVDLSARLGNLEATADRVRNFLDETKNVEEALAVNAELSRLEEQIEVIKGRMQFLSQSAAFSTITVSLTPDELNQPIEVGGWRPQGIARDAIEALIEALQGIASFLIWLVIFFLPIVLIIGLPVYFIGRRVRRWWRQRRIQEVQE